MSWIGQSAATGAISLALVLIIGFGLHNATEGFGIIGPMSGEAEIPSWGFLGLMGLIGGGPTFLGTVIGQFMISPFVGVTDGRPVITADSREVDRVFDVALSDLLAEGVYREERWAWGLDGTERAMQFFELEDETVWGATARILTGFLAQVLDVTVDGDWGDWTRA